MEGYRRGQDFETLFVKIPLYFCVGAKMSKDGKRG
jgi:hypothetical protein